MSEGGVDQLSSVNVEFVDLLVSSFVGIEGIDCAEGDGSDDEAEEEVFHGWFGFVLYLDSTSESGACKQALCQFVNCHNVEEA